MQLTRSQNCILSLFIASNSFHTLVHCVIFYFPLQRRIALVQGRIYFLLDPLLDHVQCVLSMCYTLYGLCIYDSMYYILLHLPHASTKLTSMHEFYILYSLAFFLRRRLWKYVKNGWLACK